VLKGVDGVVFVADSQRAMLQANQESFHNLEENLAEMGLSADTLPLVLQFNKRDLADICTVDEMNAALNRHNWPWFEASAVTGMGVFETLKGISKQTLLSLKKRLGRSEPSSPPPRPSAAARPAAPPAAAPAPPPRPAAAASAPQAAPPPAAPAAPPRPAAQAASALPPPAARPPAPAAAPAPPKAPPSGKGRTVDVLSELEKLRKEAMHQPATAPAARSAASAAAAAAAGTNGRGELSRTIELTLRRSDFQRARRFLVSFQVEDDQNRVMDAVRDLQVDIKDAAGLEKLLLRLNIALNAKE